MAIRKIGTFSVTALMALALTACAQTKTTKTGKTKTVKAAKTNVINNNPVLLQATRQTTLPGRPETEPTTDYRFVIVWKSKEEPTAFFWKGENGWQACNTAKVKNYTPLVIKHNSNGTPVPRNYENVTMRTMAYKNGDTIELYPISEGKHPMPATIPADKNNIIYYKTANSKWLALPVDSIIKLPSIAMP